MRTHARSVICFCLLMPFILLAQETQRPEKLQWVKLGQTAQIRDDFFSHVFRFPKKADVFSKLELRIEGVFKLDLIIVEYEDGTRWSPTTYPRIPIRGSYAIDLPDNGKKIKAVEIRYRDVGGPINTAAVDLWGGRIKKPKS